MTTPPLIPNAATRSGMALLAAASAGLLTQSVSAAAYTEPPDLPDSNSAPKILDPGVDTVFASVLSNSDTEDHFQFFSLVPLSLMEMTTHWTISGGGVSFHVYLYDSSTPFPIDSIDTNSSGSDQRNVVVPSDGILRFVTLVEGALGVGVNYDLQLVPIPEAKTIAAAAVAGLAALLSARRHKS